MTGVCPIPTYADLGGNGYQKILPWSLDMHGKRIRVFSSAPPPTEKADAPAGHSTANL